MYATRLLSMYKRNPSALSDPPPSGPNSGYLVLFDEEAPQSYSCFGFCKDSNISSIKDFPFPQNKDLTISYTYSPNTYGHENIQLIQEVMFLPVLNQPLSSNHYYVIRRRGKYQGQANTSLRETDMDKCLCFSFAIDVKPRPLEPFNEYQQVEIIKKKKYGFLANSIASDGILPAGVLKENGWRLCASTPLNYHLEQALGSNDSLRSKLPNFDFPISNYCSEAVVVGKWYSPFMFVKEGIMKLKEQMKMTVFYELTLVQRWEKIFTKENENNGENNIVVDFDIQTEVVKVGGREAVWDGTRSVDGVLWFKSVGLSLEVVKAMKWEQERFGWIAGNGRQVKVRVRKGMDGNKWKKFSCYVLVESFVLKRMDGRLVLTYDFRHSNQIMSKWE